MQILKPFFFCSFCKLVKHVFQSKTLDLTFKIYWTKLPTIANESLTFGGIYGEDEGTWQTILAATLYCDKNGYRGWNIWTGTPSGRGGFVPGKVVYALETNRWYTIRMTANLNTGTYKMHMDGTELAAIADVVVPADVDVDFFRFGAGVKGESIFVTYYDDVSVSSLGASPSPHQWSVRITSSSGGSTNPYGTTTLADGESLTVSATQAAGYVFNKWVLDGADYGTRSVVTVPAQLAGTQHTLHATFTSTSPDSDPEFNWLPLQVIGLCMIVGGGYVLWSRKERESTNIVTSESVRTQF